MLDLTTALKRGAEAYQKLMAEPPKAATAGTSEADTFAFAPAGLAAPPDDLQLPAALAAANDNLALPPAAPLGFASAETPSTPAADPVDALEDALRHRLRRYPSIQRKEELL